MNADLIGGFVKDIQESSLDTDSIHDQPDPDSIQDQPDPDSTHDQPDHALDGTFDISY